MAKHFMDKPSNDLLSRLATTVRADAPTVLVGQSGRLEPKPSSSKATSHLSRLKDLLPGRKLKGQNRSAKSLKKLAHQMAKGKPVMKKRTTRLAAVITLVVALLGAGGYTLYRTISLPKVPVAKVAKNWLEDTSGKRRATGSHPKKRLAKKKYKPSRHKLSQHGKNSKHRLAHKKHKRSKARLAHKKHKRSKAHLARKKLKSKRSYQTASYKAE